MDSPISNEKKLRVGILGGGPAGLVAALALEQYAPEQIDVVLLDRNKSESDYPGVEYGIQERACRALHRIGLKDDALRRGNPNTEIAYSVVRKGKVQGVVKVDPQWCITVVRQEFLADLAALLQTTTVHRRTHVEQVTPGAAGRVALHCRTQAGDRPVYEFDCLIAADGVQSIARKTFFPDFAKTYDRGFSCIYMLVEARGESTPAHFQRLANGGRSELFMGSFSTMTMFPLGQERLALGIGFDHATRDRLWAEVGLAGDVPWPKIDATRKRAIALRLASDVPAHDSLFVKLLSAFVPDWDSYKIYLWGMKDSDPLPTPYVSSANVAIIGDAAHAFMPTIGMGASLAIEDAEMLAARLAAVARRYADRAQSRRALKEEVFVPFTRARLPVWNDLMYRARWAAQSNFLHQGARGRFSIAPQIPGFIPSRMVGAMEWVAARLHL